MIEEDFGAKVYVCRDGCKGMWFDHFMLDKLDQNNEGLGNALQEALNYPRVNDQNRGPLPCPKCHVPMHIHKYYRTQEVNVDECYQCGGYFLDSGELAAVRNKAMTDQEVDTYTNKLAFGITQDPSDLRVSASNKLGAILQTHYWNRGL